MKKVIYPGSFDPFTKGHKDLLERTGEKFSHVIVGVGQNPDKKYMFSIPEKVEMIKGATKKGLNENLNVEVIPFSGLLVDFAFEKGVNTIVRGIRGAGDLEGESLLHWVGESQKLGIDTVFLLAKQDQTHVSSSTTKAILKEQGLIQDYVTLNVKHFLETRMMGQYLVGLTGTIGAGKSYITDSFVALGLEQNIPVYNIDLDKIGHRILETATDEGYVRVRQELISAFGDKIKKEDGFIDRKALGEIVFNNNEKRKKLDEILYTPIILKIRKEMVGKKGIILLNGALLAEAGITDLTNNNVVLIGVDKQVQQTRLSGRGHNSKQIETRINSQFSTSKKREVLGQKIEKTGYGNAIEFENNGNNSTQIKKIFNQMLSSVDVFGELRIKSVLAKLGMEDKWLEIYGKIKPMYDNPDRLYHNWFHVVACLNELYEVKEYLFNEEFIPLVFAIIFHDAVYNSSAKKGENENNSALLAEKILKDLNIEQDIIDRTKELIKLTASHTIDSNEISEKYMMIDFDLSILGQDWDKYYQYSKSIRGEYSIYSEKDYTAGRLSFLKGMLSRQIFQTPYFQEKYEKQAKLNIEKEITLLENSQKG
ncbi:pantetheine-phosphate adenylyltransferase [Candidatus Gracilibacteria bacterium]|nr:pantetheine-phosphate adenylyltransferase [Candidatus Gracilibacteria bacterium]